MSLGLQVKISNVFLTLKGYSLLCLYLPLPFFSLLSFFSDISVCCSLSCGNCRSSTKLSLVHIVYPAIRTIIVEQVKWFANDLSMTRSLTRLVVSTRDNMELHSTLLLWELRILVMVHKNYFQVIVPLSLLDKYFLQGSKYRLQE